jgi:TRAP-type C4-dicarboxylate transport system permease small subunit
VQFRRIIQASSRLSSGVGMFLIFPMMLLTSVDVIARKFWHFPLPGTLELSEYMLAAFILLGMAYTQQMKGNARLTLLHDRLSTKMRVVVDAITTSLSVLIAIALCWQGFVISAEERAVSEVLRIPQWPFKLLLSFGALLLTLELMVSLIDQFRGSRRT